MTAEVSAPVEFELTPAQAQLLGDIERRNVCFSRGIYRLFGPGMPQIGDDIHILRARGLAVLVRTPKGERMPPTRLVELTEAGRELWVQLGRP